MSGGRTEGDATGDGQTGSSLPRFTRIGSGGLGSKAENLRAILDEILRRSDLLEFPGVSVEVPRFAVVAARAFDAFMERNRFSDIASRGLSDSQIAMAFQKGQLTEEVVDELRALIKGMRSPLALRPSSVLERALDYSGSGVYAAKLIANNEPDDEARLAQLVAALKLSWASGFFADAVMSRRSAGQSADTERMAVIVQQVVGEDHGERFYPTLSACARSYNHYPVPGNRPEDGAVTLALGLGKTIVDGGHTWSYCPRRPTAPPPFRDARDLLKNTQNSFWAINLAGRTHPDAHRDTEYLVLCPLADAEKDGELKYLASTYDADSDRLRSGLGSGPRALTFAPLLRSRLIPFTEVIDRLLEMSRGVVGGDAEVMIAATLDREAGLPMRLGILQLRPQMAEGTRHPITEDEIGAGDVVAASASCLGNGVRDGLVDVVYLRPETFSASMTRSIAAELDAVNRGLVDEGRQAIFIGFGRWGTSDPRFGVPVVWRQISAAQVIVEITLPGAPASLSQGCHFFHRLLSSRVLYLQVEHDGPHTVDWDWLDGQTDVWESRHVRHVRLERPLEVRVDGASRRGLVRRSG